MTATVDQALATYQERYPEYPWAGSNERVREIIEETGGDLNDVVDGMADDMQVPYEDQENGTMSASEAIQITENAQMSQLGHNNPPPDKEAAYTAVRQAATDVLKHEVKGYKAWAALGHACCIYFSALADDTNMPADKTKWHQGMFERERPALKTRLMADLGEASTTPEEYARANNNFEQQLTRAYRAGACEFMGLINYHDGAYWIKHNAMFPEITVSNPAKKGTTMVIANPSEQMVQVSVRMITAERGDVDAGSKITFTGLYYRIPKPPETATQQENKKRGRPKAEKRQPGGQHDSSVNEPVVITLVDGDVRDSIEISSKPGKVDKNEVVRLLSTGNKVNLLVAVETFLEGQIKANKLRELAKDESMLHLLRNLATQLATIEEFASAYEKAQERAQEARKRLASGNGDRQPEALRA